VALQRVVQAAQVGGKRHFDACWGGRRGGASLSGIVSDRSRRRRQRTGAGKWQRAGTRRRR
jgi:hypothetical protein